MSEKRFVCIDVGYGDDWYITDNGKRLSEIEIVDLLNEQQATINKQENEMYFKNKLILDIMTKLKDMICMQDDYYSKELMEMILERLKILEMELEE